jgi:hypothetical protein
MNSPVAGSNPGSYKQQRVCFFFLKKNTAGAALRSLARTREGREERFVSFRNGACSNICFFFSFVQAYYDHFHYYPFGLTILLFRVFSQHWVSAAHSPGYRRTQETAALHKSLRLLFIVISFTIFFFLCFFSLFWSSAEFFH